MRSNGIAKRELGLGLSAGLGIFAVVTAYAFLSAATYRTTAVVVVEASRAGVPLPSPAEAVHRLRTAALTAEQATELAQKHGISMESGAEAAKRHFDDSVRMDTRDARLFDISCTDDDAGRAREICNAIARIVVARAPAALSERPATSPLDAEREKRIQDLASFVASHPELAAETTETAQNPSGNKEPDALLQKLVAEKTRLERKLYLPPKRVEPAGEQSDNPYEDLSEAVERAELKRKLQDVDAAIAARRLAMDKKAGNRPAPKVNPELDAEWKRKLRAVADISMASAPDSEEPELTARVLAEAPLPDAPVRPNRPLLMVFGSVLGALMGAMTVGSLRLSRRRTKARGAGEPLPAVDPDAHEEDFESPTTLRGYRSPSPAPSSPPPPEAEPPERPRRRVFSPTLIRGTPKLPAEARHVSSTPPAAEGGSARPPGDSSSPPPRPSSPLPPARPSSPLPPARSSPLPPARSSPLPPARSSPLPPTQRPPAFAREPAATASKPEGGSGGWQTIRAVQHAQPAAGSSTTDGHFTEKVSIDVVGTPSGGDIPPAENFRGTRPFGTPAPVGTRGSRSSNPPPPHAGATTRTFETIPPPPPEAETPPPKTEGSESGVIAICDVPRDWKPSESLVPQTRRALRDQLYPLALEQCFVVAISSVPGAEEAKTRVAAELSLALAESGHPRILLMEGNFHRPAVHRSMKIEVPVGWGFSQQLHARVHGEIVQGWAVTRCMTSLHVLSEGFLRSPGMLLSKQYEDSLRELRTYYDIIVIDAPDSSLPMDCRAIDSVSDGLVIVAPNAGERALSDVKSVFSGKRFTAIVTDV